MFALGCFGLGVLVGGILVVLWAVISIDEQNQKRGGANGSQS